MDQRTRIITVLTFTFLGVYTITCGVLYPKYEEAHTKTTAFLLVEQKQVGIKKDLTLKLKEVTTEVNIPLSVKIIDYLDQEVSSEVLAELKLDTSEVNVQQPGEYSYKVFYKKKSFKGKVIVKEKATPIVPAQQTITLKTVTIKLGELLSSDLSTYIIEPITEEQKAQMTLDLTRVDPNKPAKYTYTISYNGAYYQGELNIIEDKPVISDGNQNQSTPEDENVTTTPTPNTEDTTTETP